MFEPISRYAQLETAQMTLPDGRIVAYKRRRFLPQGRQLQLLTEVTVIDGDRLDLISDRILGNAQLFWQVCDANQTLRVPVPQV
jgi:hypothetical protein